MAVGTQPMACRCFKCTLKIGCGDTANGKPLFACPQTAYLQGHHQLKNYSGINQNKLQTPNYFLLRLNQKRNPIKMAKPNRATSNNW